MAAAGVVLCRRTEQSRVIVEGGIQGYTESGNHLWRSAVIECHGHQHVQHVSNLLQERRGSVAITQARKPVAVTNGWRRDRDVRQVWVGWKMLIRRWCVVRTFPCRTGKTWVSWTMAEDRAFRSQTPSTPACGFQPTGSGGCSLGDGLWLQRAGRNLNQMKSSNRPLGRFSGLPENHPDRSYLLII